MQDVTLHLGDCLEFMPTLADNSVDLIATDPPYYKVKGDAWDRQWNTPALFLAWLDKVLAEFYRILKPNGSLYLFASPKMAARVEVLIAERFNVVNSITWAKPGQSYAEKYGPENFRGFVEMSERVIFAEHYGADNIAQEGAGYEKACQDLCRRVFQIGPLAEGIGITRAQIAKLIECDYKNEESAKAQASNWILGKNIPNPVDFDRLKTVLPILGKYEDLRREYDDLRREYDDLRREYDNLRRPFQVTADVPYTDVWTFPTVSAYPGKHPTEKPIAIMEHIVKASSKPGAVVLDAFMGGGVTGKACQNTGREFIGCEISPEYFAIAQRRIAEAQLQPPLFPHEPQPQAQQLPLDTAHQS